MRSFVDTNVLIYLIGSDAAKASKAEDVLSGGGVTSVQVLGEFANVARRKSLVDWIAVRDILKIFRSTLDVRPVTLFTHDRGLGIAERYRFSVFDSMIIAAAVEAGCTTLLSEDMQHGQQVETLVIKNPFIA